MSACAGICDTYAFNDGKRVRRKATEKSTWGYALSDFRAQSSFTSVILHHANVEKHKIARGQK